MDRDRSARGKAQNGKKRGGGSKEGAQSGKVKALLPIPESEETLVKSDTDQNRTSILSRKEPADNLGYNFSLQSMHTYFN